MFQLLLVLLILPLFNCSDVLEDEWIDFKTLHNISYLNSKHEEVRRTIFRENFQKIVAHNTLYAQGLTTYKLGVTKFADLTPDEYRNLLSLKQRSNRQGKSRFHESLNGSVPSSIDWRKLGAVTAVKDQGTCGSCWAFSVIGSLEGQYYKKFGKLLSFSEQQLVDCAKYGAEGCTGGMLDSGFQYIQSNGIETETTYPYEMYNDKCQADPDLFVTKLQDYVDLPANDEEQLRAAVGLQGPVSVAIDASDFNLRFYQEGIYQTDECSQTELNHAVLVVGYDTDDIGLDFWIIKNSWGLNFGVDGYLYMRRGVNQCGIAMEPSYPVL